MLPLWDNRQSKTLIGMLPSSDVFAGRTRSIPNTATVLEASTRETLCVPETALAVAAVVRVVAAGAAANGEEPEEGRDDGEGGCDPGYCKRAGAEVYFDVVGVEEGVEGAGEGGEEDCGGEGGEEGEEGGDLVR